MAKAANLIAQDLQSFDVPAQRNFDVPAPLRHQFKNARNAWAINMYDDAAINALAKAVTSIQDVIP